jgi:hypothetical protein
MKLSAIVIVVAVTLAGCQTAHQSMKSAGLDNSGFMRLWTTYESCQSSLDLGEMRGYERILSQEMQSATRIAEPLIPLPTAIQRLVTEPKPRLSVDPKAMAAACSLYTGQAALAIGRNDIAIEMFVSVLSRHPQADYAYYVAQAKEGLAQVAVAGRSGAPQLLPVSLSGSSAASPTVAR